MAALLLASLAAWPAAAGGLREAVAGLRVLPVPYGVSMLMVQGRGVMLIRAERRGDAAGGFYAVGVRDDLGLSIATRETEEPVNELFFETHVVPGAAAVSALHFLVQRGAPPGGPLRRLYALWLERPGLAPGPVTAILYRLRFANHDLGMPVDGIPNFHPIAQATSARPYCDLGEAARRELGLSLPADPARPAGACANHDDDAYPPPE